MKIKYIAAVLIAIAGFGLQQANAFTSDLNQGNSAISGFTGPYGTVVITLVGQTATVTFTSNTVGGNIYLFGDGGSVALNVNASTFTVGTVTGTNSGVGFTPGPFTTNIAAGQHEDGFGTFNLTIDSFDGYTHTSNVISFTVTNTSGTPWGSANDVLAFNASGIDAAAHIFITTFPANSSGSAIVTGFAGEGRQAVPDGGTTVMLLGAALGALGMARRFIMS
jgi:hypothetical protein